MCSGSPNCSRHVRRFDICKCLRPRARDDRLGPSPSPGRDHDKSRWEWYSKNPTLPTGRSRFSSVGGPRSGDLLITNCQQSRMCGTARTPMDGFSNEFVHRRRVHHTKIHRLECQIGCQRPLGLLKRRRRERPRPETFEECSPKTTRRPPVRHPILVGELSSMSRTSSSPSVPSRRSF